MSSSRQRDIPHPSRKAVTKTVRAGAQSDWDESRFGKIRALRTYLDEPTIKNPQSSYPNISQNISKLISQSTLNHSTLNLRIDLPSPSIDTVLYTMQELILRVKNTL